MNALYTTTATATGGRDGSVASSDGILNLQVRLPKELGGSGGQYTNPEQLFAAGFAVCFDNALNLVIRMAKVKTGITSVTSNVSLGKFPNGSYGMGVKLEVEIPEVDTETAKSLVARAEQVCPFSNATRGNIPFEIVIKELV
jgi:lipoyl-dependent peroxiredoxin